MESRPGRVNSEVGTHEGGSGTKLTPPSRLVFWIAFVGAIIGLLTALHIIVVPALAGYIFWIVLGALILLLLGVIFKGL